MNDPYVKINYFNLSNQSNLFFRAFAPNYEENWRWRFKWEQLKQSTKGKLKLLTYIYGRYLPKEVLEQSDTEAIVDEKTDSNKQLNSY
jgi:hypothetical protein